MEMLNEHWSLSVSLFMHHSSPFFLLCLWFQNWMRYPAAARLKIRFTLVYSIDITQSDTSKLGCRTLPLEKSLIRSFRCPARGNTFMMVSNAVSKNRESSKQLFLCACTRFYTRVYIAVHWVLHSYVLFFLPLSNCFFIPAPPRDIPRLFTRERPYMDSYNKNNSKLYLQLGP